MLVCLLGHVRGIFSKTWKIDRAAKVLKPCDVSKEKLLEAFTKALKCKGYLHNLVKAAVADEPHKHYQPDGASRERHKHLIFLFRAPFVHAGVRKLLAEEFGYHGFFTFHRAGWCAYLDYLMMESAKKPAHDLDRDLVFYPSSYTKQKADGELAGMSSQVAGRKKNEGAAERSVGGLAETTPAHVF